MKLSLLRRPTPALVLACVALGISLAGNAGAIDFGADAKLKPTISIAYHNFSVPAGGVETADAECPPGDYALSGGYGLASGNFVYIVTAATKKDGDGFRVTAEVPNKLAAPGVQPASIVIKVVCAQEGRPVVP